MHHVYSLWALRPFLLLCQLTAETGLLEMSSYWSPSELFAFLFSIAQEDLQVLISWSFKNLGSFLTNFMFSRVLQFSLALSKKTHFH